MSVSSIANTGAGVANAPATPAADQRPDASKRQPAKKVTPAVETPVVQRTVSKTEFNPDAQRVVFQLIHPLSETVVAQFPSESLLNVREYVSDRAARNAPPSVTVRA